jgi:hypothetical protein
MATKKFIAVTTATDITNMSYFVGTVDNGDGTGTDYKFSLALLIASILPLMRKQVTASATGDTLTDSWFDDKDILTLITNGQVYTRNVDFTQSGDTITGTTISFYNSQIIVAQL